MPLPAAPDDHVASAPTDPIRQHLTSEAVRAEMARNGHASIRHLDSAQVVVLSLLAGAFIASGALFSLLIAAGTESPGTRRLLEGFGFSAGFFLVVLSGAVLFTEANVEMPAVLLGGSGRGRDVARLWLIAPLGNLAGAALVGLAVAATHPFDAATLEVLDEVLAVKMRFAGEGGAVGWSRAVLSGVLANWLVGMAAFTATMGRTIIGKYIPILLTVMMFVAAGFLHAPANMAFLALATPQGAGPGWGDGLLWSILPAAVGNVFGAVVLVALPFWFVARTRNPNPASEQ